MAPNPFTASGGRARGRQQAGPGLRTGARWVHVLSAGHCHAKKLKPAGFQLIMGIWVRGCGQRSLLGLGIHYQPRGQPLCTLLIPLSCFPCRPALPPPAPLSEASSRSQILSSWAGGEEGTATGLAAGGSPRGRL